MIPKYPFLIFPLFLVTSFYFYQIKMVTVSEIYVFLYISFLLSYSSYGNLREVIPRSRY